MLENETHLVFVLLLGEDLGGVWNGSDSLLDLFVSTLKMCPGIANIFFDFLLQGEELWVLLLNIESLFQLVDFWDLRNNLYLLFLETRNHIWVESTWLMLDEHLIDGATDNLSLISNILLNSRNFFLDRLELGKCECAAHFALLRIPHSLIKLKLELANHILIGLHKALEFLLLFNKPLVRLDIILISQRGQIQITKILILDGLAVIQEQSHG